MSQITHIDSYTDRVLVSPLPRECWHELRSSLRDSERRWVQRPELISYRRAHPWYRFSEQFRRTNECGYTEQLWTDGWTFTTEHWPEDFREGDRIGYQVILEIDLVGEWFLIGCDCGLVRLRHYSDFRYLHLACFTCGSDHRDVVKRRTERNSDTSIYRLAAALMAAL